MNTGRKPSVIKWRKRARVLAYTEVMCSFVWILLTLIIPAIAFASMILNLDQSIPKNLTEKVNRSRPCSKAGTKSGGGGDGLMWSYVLIWAWVAIAITVGMQIWASTWLAKSTEPERDPANALELARDYKSFSIGLLLEVLVGLLVWEDELFSYFGLPRIYFCPVFLTIRVISIWIVTKYVGELQALVNWELTNNSASVSSKDKSL